MKSIEIAFGRKAFGYRSRVGNILYEMILSILFFVGVYMSYVSLFGLSYNAGQILLAGAAVIAVISIFSEKSWFLPAAMIVFAAVFAVVLLADAQTITDGLKTAANQVLETAGRAGKTTFMEFSLAGSGKEEFYGSCFLVFPAIVTAFLSAVAVKYRRLILAAVMAVPVFILQSWLSQTPEILFNLLMVFMLLVILGRGFWKRMSMKDVQELNAKKQAVVVISMGVVFAAVIAAVSILAPESAYTKSNFTKDIRDKSADRIFDMRYEEGKPNSFTQGDFLRLTHLELWEEPALDVTMSEPQSYYLRGFVGSVYTPERWEEADSEKTYEEYSMNYWLHQSGFCSLNQLSLLESLGVAGSDAGQVKISVDNVNANSKYLYLPYELTTAAASFSKTDTHGDTDVASRKLKGERYYTYQASANITGRYSELLTAVNQGTVQNQSLIADYKKSELNYRKNVYADYLDVPGNVNSLLYTLLGEKTVDGDLHVDYQQAITFVKDYLKNHVTYDTEAAGVSRGTDFLTNFLNQTKKGYSVHYATAATMMFRYMGIPSRYVEGYLITPKNIEGVADGETIHIQGMNAHAWTEIYQDGIGWIPVETTPPYYGIMDQAQVPGSSIMSTEGSNGGDNDSAGDAPEEVQPPDEAETLDKDRLELADILRIIGWLIIVLIAAAIIGGGIFLVVRRRKALARREEIFSGEDKKQAICHMFAYMELMFEAAGIKKTGASVGTYRDGIGEKWSKAYAKRYDTVLSTGQKAAFSMHDMTEQEVKDVSEYKDMILLKLTDGQKWKEKMKYKYWKCLY